MRRYMLIAIAAALLLATVALPALQSQAELGGEYVPLTQTITPGNQRLTAGVGPQEFPPAEAPRVFSHVLIRRDAEVPPGATLLLELRASPDGQGWSAWASIEPNDDLAGPDDGPGVIWSQIFEVGMQARFWQVRATTTAAPDGATPVIRQIDVHTVDAASGPTNPAPDQITPTSKAGPSLTNARLAASRPSVVSRTAWGSPDGQGSRAAPRYSATTHMVVHHTADSSALYPREPNWAARVRAIWSYHAITRGWGDIGYNYLIDPNGVVYEGRAGGDDAVAFHDTANYGSMGVSMLGTYSSLPPTQATQDSLVQLLAWKAAQRGINPTGSSFYYGCTISNYCLPFNAGGVVPNIAGHRQVTPGHTTCPGDATMALMPQLRERVRQLVGSEVQPTAQVDLVGFEVPRTTVGAGELIEVRFMVRNNSQSTVDGQAPQVDLNSADAFSAYTYRQNECFNGDPAGQAPLFAKEAGRVRVALGVPGWDSSNPGRCNGATSSYPWRWGLNGSLRPGEERTIIGYVQFNTPGNYTLQAGVVQEYVGYSAQGIGQTNITVTPERMLPEAAAYNSALQPLAQVFRLADQPNSHLARALSPASVARGAYMGSFAWSGEALDWGTGGPLGLSDRFVIVQARSFIAAQAGQHTFRITADDGAWLLVDGQVVASVPGLHPVQSATGTIQLGAGVHSIAVIGFEAGESAYLAYDYQPPGAGSFQLIPDAIASQPNSGGSFVGSPTIALGSDDMAGSGVVQMRWSMNDGPWQDNLGAVLQIGRLQRGSYTLRYQAIDGAGNSSTIQELRFGVEAPAPPPPTGAFRAFLPSVNR
jgi:N-acetylmuramoyl-L-alanine amidase